MSLNMTNGKNKREAYRFHAGAALDGELERLLTDQLVAAVLVLESEDVPAETAVHEARKSFKKARSALRLARYAMPDDWRPLQQEIAAVARELSALRDADALIGAVDNLQKEAETSLRLAGCEAVRAELVKARRDRQRQAVDATMGGKVHGASRMPTRLGKQAVRAEEERAMMLYRTAAARKVKGLVDKIAAGDFSAVDAATLGKGLRHIRKKARQAMRDAFAKRDAESIHEWRKGVKHYWYAALLFDQADAVPVKTGKLKQLAELLGDHHDLEILRARAMEHADAFPSAREALAFLALIDQRSRQMEGEAFALGEKLLGKRLNATTRKLKALPKAKAQPASASGATPRPESGVVDPPSNVSPSSSSSSMVSTGVGSPDSRRGPALEATPC